jgi:thiol-disulfide isomerase/thioredoxin
MRTLLIICCFFCSLVCINSCSFAVSHPQATPVKSSNNSAIKSDDSILKEFAKTNQLYFFYDGNCPYCKAFAPIIKKFAGAYGFKVVPVTLDYTFVPEFPNSVYNTDQDEKFHLGNGVPNLFAYNPHTMLSTLVADGYVDSYELKKNVLKAAKKAVNN